MKRAVVDGFPVDWGRVKADADRGAKSKSIRERVMVSVLSVSKRITVVGSL